MNRQYIKALFVGVICLMPLFISGCDRHFSLFNKAVSTVEKSVATSSSNVQEEKVQKQKKIVKSTQTKHDTLSEANDILKNKNTPYKLSAVSRFDEDGFFGLDTSKGITFVVYDKKDDMVARVDYNKKILKPREMRYGKTNAASPMTFNMYVENDNENGADKKLGVWSGVKHQIPIYVLFELDENNNIVPGMISSAQGSNPSHYHSALKEQKNINLVNIVLTHVDSLNEDIIKRGISLP